MEERLKRYLNDTKQLLKEQNISSIPYIRHYYILENGVQKMYIQYDEFLQKEKN